MDAYKSGLKNENILQLFERHKNLTFIPLFPKAP